MKKLNDNEIKRLIDITETEPICIDSYMCLKEDESDGQYVRWGWNTELKEIRDHFLFVFVTGTILQYNISKGINKISDEFVMSCINGTISILDNFSNIEKIFFDKWCKIHDVDNFEKLKKTTKKLCEYLTSIGYKMSFILYENPKKALSKALEIDKYLPNEELGFGKFLKANIDDEDNIKPNDYDMIS